MFKTPEWEDDVPKTHTNFMKRNQVLQKKTEKRLQISNNNISLKVKKSNKKGSSNIKLKVLTKVNNHAEYKPVNFKTKVTPTNLKEKNITTSKRVNNKSSKLEPIRKSTQSMEIQVPEAQNFDEILLNAKKKKFNEVIVNDDQEKGSSNFKLKELTKVNNHAEYKPVNFNTKVTPTNLKEKNITTSNSVKNKSSKRKVEPIRKSTQSMEIQVPEAQNFDEILLNAKKKKFNEVIVNDDQEDLLFTESKLKKKNIQHVESNNKMATYMPAEKKKYSEVIENGDQKDLLFTENKPKKKKIIHNVESNVMLNNNNMDTYMPPNSKKNRFKSLIDSKSNRRHIDVDSKSQKLRQRMLERLKAAQFRYLNEKLYTSSGSEAQQLFKEDPGSFEIYHQGYQLQVKKWPVNPLDVIMKKIMKMPKSHLIADMGCGEAALSRRIPHTTRSFDLVATGPGVETCDMARTPLLKASMDVAVYCLALMGTDLTQYLVEANRVLKMGGHLLIAEVESRFDNVDTFTKEVQRLGFKLKHLDKSNQVFYFMEFTKVQDPPTKKGKLPALTLKPCIYKKR